MVSGTSSCLCRHGATAESGCSRCCTQLPQTGFIPEKPRKTVTLTWSILPLSENSINSAAAYSKGSDWIWVRWRSPGLASARHQVSPTSWSTQIWSQNVLLSACLLLTATTVTRTTHITRKAGTFPSKTTCCLSLFPFRCLWVTPVFTVTPTACHPTEKGNPIPLWGVTPVPINDVEAWGCHVPSLNKETQACPSP